MSPLKLKIFRERQGGWVTIGDVKPGDRPGSISDNKADGARDVYVFKCSEDDSKSTIYRSEGGVDTEKGDIRTVIPLEGLTIVKELKKGESYEIEVKTDVSKEPRKIRFSHE